MFQKREQLWWLAACVVGLLVAGWAAGGFIGPLVAVFVVVFLAGAVLIEVEGHDHRDADVQDRPAEPAGEASAGVEQAEADAQRSATEPDETRADAIEAAESLA